MRFILQLVSLVVIAFLGSFAIEAAGGRPWLTLAVGITAAAAGIIGYRWIVRVTEHRSPVELRWPGAVGAAGRGTAIGMLLFAAVIGVIALLGGYGVTGTGSWASAVALVGVMVCVAATEELIFRGVLFRWIENRAGTWIALWFSSLLFGLVHAVNPNASLWGAIAIAVEAGGMMTAAYIATRNLWLPVGLHFGWNAAASAIFSTEVSGGNTPQGILETVMTGPILLTGGDFGPEGSIFAVLFCTLVTVVFLVVAARRGNIVSYSSARSSVRDMVAP